MVNGQRAGFVRSVDEGVGAYALAFGLEVRLEYSSEELLGALDTSDHAGLEGVGKDRSVPRFG